MVGYVAGYFCHCQMLLINPPHLAKHAVRVGKSLQNYFLPRRQFVDSTSVAEESFLKSLRPSSFCIPYLINTLPPSVSNQYKTAVRADLTCLSNISLETKSFISLLGRYRRGKHCLRGIYFHMPTSLSTDTPISSKGGPVQSFRLKGTGSTSFSKYISL